MALHSIKNITLFILSFLLVASGQLYAQEQIFMFSYFKGNGEDGLHLAYSRDGKKWKALNQDQSVLQPQVGEDKLMRDPCIIQGPDGKFHMVWTVSWGEKGIGYASSEDLVKWSEQKYIGVMEHEDKARNCWAPEISYDQQSKKYIIYWSTTIPGKFPETEKTGDDGYNHRMYYVTTSDFTNFSEVSLLYDQGFNVIDGTIAKVNDKYVMVLKDETRHPAQKNLRVASAESIIGPYSKASAPITGKYWAEGPSIVKDGNYWLVYFDKYTEGSMGAIMTKDWKNWTEISDQLSFPEGTRHGTVFKVSEDILEKLLATF